MALCLLAIPIFAFFGIFSVKYRKLTKDALDCLFKTITLRKCNSGLDDKIKADITGIFLRYSPKLARFTYKNYKLLSWIVMFLFIWSAYGSAIGLYNYSQYGNCNTPDEVGFCIFDPGTGASEVETIPESEREPPKLENNDPILGPKDAELTIIQFGCFACPYTKKAEPIVQEVIDYYEGRVNFQFKTFLIPWHNGSRESALASNCAFEQGMYHEYHKQLFTYQKFLGNDTYKQIAKNIGLNETQFWECFSKQDYTEVDEDSLMGRKAGVPGTPTFFIGDQKIVGPKPFKTFKKIINKELKK